MYLWLCTVNKPKSTGISTSPSTRVGHVHGRGSTMLVSTSLSVYSRMSKERDLEFEYMEYQDVDFLCLQLTQSGLPCHPDDPCSTCTRYLQGRRSMYYCICVFVYLYLEYQTPIGTGRFDIKKKVQQRDCIFFIQQLTQRIFQNQKRGDEGDEKRKRRKRNKRNTSPREKMNPDSYEVWFYIYYYIVSENREFHT